MIKNSIIHIVYFLSLSLVLPHYTWAQERFFEVFSSKNSPLPYDFVNGIAIDDANTKWIATDNGLLKMGTDTILYNKSKLNIQNNAIKSVFADHSGNKYLGTYSDGLIILTPQNTIQNIKVPKNEHLSHSVITVWVDKKHQVWIGTEEGGLFVLDASWQHLKNISEEEFLRVYNIVEDKTGKIWVGTEKGVFTTDESMRLKRFGKIKELVNYIFLDYMDNIWVSCTGKNVSYLYKNSQIERQSQGVQYQFRQMIIDNHRDFWGASIDGLVRIHDKKVEVMHPSNSTLPANSVSCIALDVEGELWIGTFGGGVMRSVKKKVEDKVVKIGESELKVGDSYSLKIQFERSKATLTDVEGLHELLEFMKKHPSAHIELAGHTDNVGIPSVNYELSLARAKAVKEYLLKRGIQSERISTKGYGGLRPISKGTDEENHKKNRRVEVIILKL